MISLLNMPIAPIVSHGQTALSGFVWRQRIKAAFDFGPPQWTLTFVLLKCLCGYCLIDPCAVKDLCCYL